MAKKGLETPDGDPVQPFDPEKVAYIINEIYSAEDEIKELQAQIKNLKNSALDAGVSKEQLAEALKYLKLEDEERNVLISQAGRVLEAMGRQPIHTKVYSKS